MRDVKFGPGVAPVAATPPVHAPPAATPTVPLGPTPERFDAPPVQVDARLADGRIDGRAYCRAVVDRIRSVKRTDPSRRCVVVFDLDNTLFETRARTLDVLRAFDAAHGSRWFADLALDDVGWNGRESCPASMPRDVVDAVDAFWEEHFWNGATFDRDLVLADLFDLAWEAKRAGAEVRYLTGRIDALKDATLGQIVGAGLPDATPHALFTKPDVATRTGPFKHDALEAWIDAGEYLGFFVTDSRAEIEAIAAADPDGRLPVVHADHPLQRPGAVALDTPTVDDLTRRLLTPDESRRRAARFGVRRPAV